MVEIVVAALRRSAQAVFRNIWLLIFEVVNSLSAPLLMGGGLLLPLAAWWLTHGMPSPLVLVQDPLGFLSANWLVLVWAFVGWSVGACLYLWVWLFYSAGLTGTIGRACGNAPGVQAASAGVAEFWQAGRRGIGPGMKIASLSALITLPPLVPLLVLAVLLIGRIPELMAADGTARLMLLLKFGVPLLGLGLAFAILSWLALVWYRYAICYAVLRSEAAGGALRRAFRFAKANWRPVLGLAVAALVLGLLTSLTFAQAGFVAERLQALSSSLTLIVSLFLMPVGWVFGIFMRIWLNAAVVTLFLEREEKV